MEGTGEGRGFFSSPKLPYLSTMWCLNNFVADFRYHLLNVTHLHITTVQILLPAFNFQRSIVEVAWWVHGAIISDHTKQHCRNKRWLLLKPELLWSHSHCSPIKWIEPSAKYILPRIQVFICLIYYYINILFLQGWEGISWWQRIPRREGITRTKRNFGNLWYKGDYYFTAPYNL